MSNTILVKCAFWKVEFIKCDLCLALVKSVVFTAPTPSQAQPAELVCQPFRHSQHQSRAEPDPNPKAQAGPSAVTSILLLILCHTSQDGSFWSFIGVYHIISGLHISSLPYDSSKPILLFSFLDFSYLFMTT